MDELFVLLIFKIHLDYASKQTKIMIKHMITRDFSSMTKNSSPVPINSGSSIYYPAEENIHEALLRLCSLRRMQRDDD